MRTVKIFLPDNKVEEYTEGKDHVFAITLHDMPNLIPSVSVTSTARTTTFFFNMPFKFKEQQKTINEKP